MSGEIDPRFAEALAAAEKAPDDEGAWDALEEIAEQLQKPEEVAQLYRTVLARPLSKDLAERIGRRAVGYHEEWFGEESPHLVEVLTRILELDPEADWALQRATVVLTVREKWDELLGLYDRALAATTDVWRRTSLLEEAAQLAKDLAGQPDRAIDYQKQLLDIRPDDAQLAASLERLLERQRRWQDLIELWRRQVEGGSANASELRVRIATTQWEQLGDASAALAELRSLLEAGEAVEDVVRLLERILGSSSAPAEVRRGALGLLREHYEAQGRSAEVERLLVTALEFVHRDEAIAIHRELGERLAERGEARGAFEHYASLLRLDPGAEDAVQRLRGLAASTGDHQRHADALVAAADAAADPSRRMALLVEAGDVCARALGNGQRAEHIYRTVLGETDASHPMKRTAARRLVALLEGPERARDRLAILEELAELEDDATERRRLLGEAAQLAERVGDVDRALSLWRCRLDRDPQDLEALEACVRILEAQGRWLELVETLRLRARLPFPPLLRRADRVRIAGIQERSLQDRAGAIATWLGIAEEFGEDVETVDALSRLFAAEQRWTDLAAMLERASRRDEARAADVSVRLADVRRLGLGDLLRAAEGYHQALKLDPRHASAREGLRALLEHPEAKAAAVEGLAEAATRTGDHDTLLALLEHRLAVAPGDRVRVRLLREAAELEERRRGDALAALRAIRRAFLLFPDDEGLEAELMRLGEAVPAGAGWSEVVSALREAISRLGSDARRAAELHRRAAVLLEARLGDDRGALDELVSAFALEPHDVGTAREIVRLGSRLGAWDAVARALVGAAHAHRKLDPELFEIAESAADEAVAWDALARATTTEMEKLVTELGASGDRRLGELGRVIETRIAVWHRDRRGDLAAAEAALARALAHEPGHTDTLRELARLQWRSPSRALVDTLLSLAERLEDDLDAWYDAARIALDPVGDPPLAKQILLRLFREATRLWERGNRTRGHRPADKTALWALEQLVALELDAGHVAEAIELLVQGARLPVHPAEARAFRRRAADLARDELGDEERALRLYQSVVEESLEDAGSIDRLAAMYETRGRLAELLALRQRELEQRDLSPERRLSVRLDVARLLGRLEERGGRIEMLRQNLNECPGHEASLSELVAVLESRGRFSELAELLTEQAGRIEGVDGARAARLWAMVARLAEGALRDPDRAIAAHCKVVSLEPTVESLDALARLALGKGDPTQAAEWLERRLEHTDLPERVAVSLRLAEARLLAGQTDRAIAALERALAEDRSAREVRDRLAELYRRTEAWEPLAQLLAEGVAYVSDEATQLAYVREAVEIYRKRLERPNAAIAILERGVQLAPDDVELRSALAEGLRVAGRLDEARAILEKLVAEFGRRRSPERAALHFQLAQVAHAEGDLKEALDQLDKASSMDLGNASILKMLGDLAREAGQLERAERAYRALLLLVRRQAGEGHKLAVGVAEVLYELSRLATERNQAAQAKELVESALEVAGQSPSEAARLTRTLMARGETDLALRTVEMRLAAATDPAERAHILADRAEIAERLLQQPREALEAQLEALELFPSRLFNDRARALAVRIGEVPRYVERVRALVDRLRRKEDAEIASELLLGLGEVIERELGDLEGAATIYRRVEERGVRAVEAWRALARIAAERGDHVEEIRVLRRLVAAGAEATASRSGDAIPESAKTEALYRIAEVELANRDTLESGLATLAEALGRSGDHRRAATILHPVAVRFSQHAEIMALYERAARGSGDPRILLDYLEIVARRPDATIECIREGVELARAIGAGEREEALLRRGVEIARATLEGLAGHLWIPLALSERRRAAGDIGEAIAWRREAAQAAEGAGDSERARELWRELAEIAAGPDGDLRLAADAYRRLLESDPTDRSLWRALADVAARLGDREGWSDAVRMLLDALLDPQDRNELRMIHASFLLDRVSELGGEAQEEAIAVLREVLDEDPDHVGAAQRLADLFERAGRNDELLDVLGRQLDRARDRQDIDAIVALTLRMGRLLEESDRDQARDLYRQGLEWAPRDARLLRALLALYGEEHDAGERAALAERLLVVETGDAAARLALELADLYAFLDDPGGVGRALELGFQAQPSNDELRTRLEAWYRDRGDAAALADMIAYDAANRSDVGEAVARFREAATIWASTLERPERAVDLLRRARELAPERLDLVRELVTVLVDCGRPEEAANEVAAALERCPEAGPERAQWLRMRAPLRRQSGDPDGEIADLEAAYEMDRAATFEELVAALDRRRQEVDLETERRLTMRLVAVLSENGAAEQGREVLAAWVDRDPGDREALGLLVEMDTSAERWEDVLRHCARLVELEQGERQVQVALVLVQAAERVGRPEDARAGLERVFQDQPGEARVRDALRAMYEAIGAYRELVGILLADAAAADTDEARFQALRRAGELLVDRVQDPAQAIEPLREALAIREDDPDTIVLLSDALIGAGALAEAVELLQNAIQSSKRKRSPQLAMMQHRMARIAGLSGDQQTQLEWLKVALESDKGNGIIAAELAELAMALGDDATAMNALKVVTLQKTPGPMSKAVAFLRQAQIAHRAGDLQKALLWARRARLEDADLAEAAEFLARLES